jgi:hypothetical protein
MRVPHLVWNRRQNVAAVVVSFGKRTWDRVDLGEVILGFNAAGRLTKVIIPDAGKVLRPDAGLEDTLMTVLGVLAADSGRFDREEQVLRSALDRARAYARAAAGAGIAAGA